ncbi:MAG: hypothetical protein Hyperionvirus2_57 [Hyperionvirus sp.]|uniref:Uncharacterized protein n=1 Tax=Hyperionvirus sp. TaxID=2487770 RepID=A0A3G5ABL5_9VIRU|nr:MAG: hypothetical protein Hyperionvirus2_57 [Hyperionvirus sp.]
MRMLVNIKLVQRKYPMILFRPSGSLFYLKGDLDREGYDVLQISIFFFVRYINVFLSEIFKI